MDGAHKLVWHEEILPPKTKKALAFLSQAPWLKKTEWYLAGGTALALQLGHRQSEDLDFFLPASGFFQPGLIKKFPKQAFKPGLLAEGTVYATLFGGKISFIAYPFFLPKCEPLWHGAVRVLAPRDIAIMKIIAISQRGRKRDFLDLYWYAKNFEPLEDLFKLLPKQYPMVRHNYHHMFKSLMFFDDAEKDKMPPLFIDVSWKEIKAYFERESPKASRKFLGLD